MGAGAISLEACDVTVSGGAQVTTRGLAGANVVRAIGALRSQVRKMIIAEALLLAGIGTAFGLLAGLYLGYVFVQGLSASGMFKMEYSFPFVALIAATAAGLIFGVLAAIIPARQASRMGIIQALRYE